MFTRVDSRPSRSIDSTHTSRLHSAGLLSLVQCSCIAAAAYWLWLYPALSGWSLLPLAVSLLPHLVVSKVVATPGVHIRRLPLSLDQFRQSKGARRLFLALFCVVPMVLGIWGVIALPLAVFLAVVSFGLLYTLDRINWSASVTPCHTLHAAMLLSSAFTAVFAGGLLLAWPHIVVHLDLAPEGVVEAAATVERSATALADALVIGRAPPEIAGSAAAFETRSGSAAISAATGNRLLLLWTPEHLHALLFLLLLGGSVIRSMVVTTHSLRLSVVYDIGSAAASCCVYWLGMRSDILTEAMPQSPWLVRGWTACLAVASWFLIRAWLETLGSAPAREANVVHESHGRRMLARYALAIGCIAGIGAVSLLEDPGTVKKGRIMIDERHSDWEKADLPMVSDVYGVKTVYNYGFLREILQKHYPVVATNNALLTPTLLEGCDVLILKTPTSPYTDAEVDAVSEFVGKGGGLWLIGDHTNIFGMNTYLNQIGDRWGVHFNADAVSPVPHYYQQRIRVPNVKAYHECGNREHENLRSLPCLNHPIIGRRIPFTTVLTSCSVSAPLGCGHISVSQGTYADSALFGNNTFFGNLEHDVDEPYGCILQNVSVTAGKGRVATWSDSTLFSNFSMCMSGVPDLVLGYVNWLNRSNTSWPPARRLAIGLLCVILGIVTIGWRDDRRSMLLVTAHGCLGLAAMLPFIDLTNSRMYQIGAIDKGFRTIGFDQEVSCLDLPNKDHVHNDDTKAFETFYVMAQRMHFMPRSSDSLDSLIDSDAIVMINPRRKLGASTAASLQNKIRDGGVLFLMVGQAGGPIPAARTRIANANVILSQLGVAERFKLHPSVEETDFHGSLIHPSVFTDAEAMARVTSVPTSTVVLKDSKNNPVIVLSRLGSGWVVVCSASEMFSNANMGEPGAVPSSKQRILIEAVLSLFEQVIPWKQDEALLRAEWDRLLQDQDRRH